MMNQEFLEALGLEPEAVEAVLTAHAQAMAGAQLQHQVAMAIGEAGGRNQVAIGALLDMEALARAEDPAAAAKAAVAAVKKENGYLFDMPKPPGYARHTGEAAPGGGNEPGSLAAALRARMGR